MMPHLVDVGPQRTLRNVSADTWSLAKFAAPVSVTFILDWGLQLVDIIFLGRLGSHQLAAAALALAWLNIGR